MNTDKAQISDKSEREADFKINDHEIKKEEEANQNERLWLTFDKLLPPLPPSRAAPAASWTKSERGLSLPGNLKTQRPVTFSTR